MKVRAALGAVGDEGAVLVTVLRTRGPAYRRAGAMVVIATDGRVLGGTISAGCLEGDLAARIPDVLAGRKAVRVVYDATDDETPWGLGLGCGGTLELLLEPLVGAAMQDVMQWLDALVMLTTPAVAGIVMDEGNGPWGYARLIATPNEEWWFNEPAAERLPTPMRDAMSSDARKLDGQRAPALARYGDGSFAVEVAWVPLMPTPQLVIGGASPDAKPVAMQAAALGWHVAVVDHRPARLADFLIPGVVVHTGDPELIPQIADGGPRTACLIMYHAIEADRRALAALLAGAPGYVGVLGPRARTVRLLHALGVSETPWPSFLHAPVGLDLGAEDADEVALSIIAELVAWHHGTRGGPLVAKDGAIHVSREAMGLAGRILEWAPTGA